MMNAKAIEMKVSTMIADDLSAMGYELVRVQMTTGGSYMTLQLMAERLDMKPMTVDDCVKISRATSDKLDADKDMVDRYTLEVSSPGIDRPLVRLKDFERFTGHLARIELEAPQDGRKRFMGSIVRITGHEQDAEIELSTENGAVRVPMSSIARAKLVLTDALMEASAAGAKH
ncbi:MAG TPA: ribosome maturation factor RimP [Alphaproteobacteria bacterium]|nr:ribosome maturation factor RimP [Alphaproteobacteria bacterium]